MSHVYLDCFIAFYAKPRYLFRIFITQLMRVCCAFFCIFLSNEPVYFLDGFFYMNIYQDIQPPNKQTTNYVCSHTRICGLVFCRWL